MSNLKRITYTFEMNDTHYPGIATVRVAYKPKEGGGYEMVLSVNGMVKTACNVYCEHSAAISQQLIQGVPELRSPSAIADGGPNFVSL